MRTYTYKHLAFSALLLLLIFAGPELAYAQSGSPAYKGLGTTIVNFAGVLAAVNTFMHILLLTILKMLGYLLQADFFNDAQMMSALNTVWQLSRNIMNVIFALALIAVSFYTIITAKTQLIKDKFAHFVIAVILVNFSWFFPRVIIDAANVLTATIYNIPNSLPGYTCEYIDDSGATVPCDVVMDAGFFLTPAEQTNFCTTTYGFPVGSPNCPCISGLGCYAKDTWLNARNTMRPAHAMVNGLAVSFAKVTNYAQIPNAINTAGGGAVNPARVTMQIVISVIMAFLVQIAVLLPLLGLGIGLFLRIVIMWITVAFMPFTFIGFLVNGKLGTNVFGFEMDVWKEFINAAFLPAVVGVPFAIGFIMLGTVASLPAPPGFNTFFVPLIPGVSGVWPLLWIFASIGIIWVGAFSALRKSQLVGKVTDKIQGFGQQAFSTAAKLPLLAPLPFPGAGKKGLAVGDLIAGPRKLRDTITQATRSGETYSELLERLQGQNQQNTTVTIDPLKNADKIVDKLNGNNTLQQKIVDRLTDLKSATTDAARKKAIQDLRADVTINSNLTDGQYADALISLEGKTKKDAAGKDLITPEIKGLIRDTKATLVNIRDNP